MHIFYIAPDLWAINYVLQVVSHILVSFEAHINIMRSS